MKFVRLTSVISMAAFCLLALQVHLTAQELQKHSFANLINDPDEMQSFSDTSTPDPLVTTTVKLYPTHLSFGSIVFGSHSSAHSCDFDQCGHEHPDHLRYCHYRNRSKGFRPNPHMRPKIAKGCNLYHQSHFLSQGTGDAYGCAQHP